MHGYPSTFETTSVAVHPTRRRGGDPEDRSLPSAREVDTPVCDGNIALPPTSRPSNRGATESSVGEPCLLPATSPDKATRERLISSREHISANQREARPVYFPDGTETNTVGSGGTLPWYEEYWARDEEGLRVLPANRQQDGGGGLEVFANDSRSQMTNITTSTLPPPYAER